MTLRLDLCGYDILFTVRGESGRDLLGKIGAVITELDKMGAKPQGNRGSGHQTGDGGKVCPVHGEPMKQYSNDKGSWWAHKVGDTWCHGKAK